MNQKKKLEFLSRYRNISSLYALKLLNVILTGFQIMLFIIFNGLTNFASFNPGNESFYKIQLPVIAMLAGSIWGVYRELPGSILIVIAFCIKILLNEIEFNIFHDLFLLIAIINLFIFYKDNDKN